jgi:hypothetical protein
MAYDEPSPEQMRKGKLIGSRLNSTPVTGGDPELEKFNRLKMVYSSYHTAMEEDDKYYHKQYGKDIVPREWVDDGFKATIPPTGNVAVETAAEHILTTPKIYVPERPSTENQLMERQVADSKQQALKFFWHNLFISGDPLGHGKKKLIKDGRLVLKKEIKWDYIDPDSEMFGVNDFLWNLRVLSNETVLEDPDDPYDPTYVYEYYTMRAGTARRFFPDAIGSWAKDKKDTDTVTYVEYWTKPHGTDKGKRCVWIDNEKVLEKDNPYHWVASVNEDGEDTYDGYIPYFIADSGWGDVNAENKPEDRYVGILRYMHDILETEARQLTAADVQTRVATFPILKGWNLESDAEKPFRIGPASLLRLNGDKNNSDVEIMPFPDLPRGVTDLLNRLHNFANELTRFNTLGGGPQKGVDTATEADLNVRNASAKLSGPVSGLQSLLTRVNKTVLQDIELVLEAPVVLYGAADSGPGMVTLNPEDINGFYLTFVQLQTSEQAALDRALLKTWGDAMHTFDLDPEYAMRQAGIENPTERIVRSAEHKVFIDPMMHQLRVMTELGEGGIKAIQLLNQLTGTGVQNEANPGFQPAQNANTGGAAEAQAITDGREMAMTMRPDLQMQ